MINNRDSQNRNPSAEKYAFEHATLAKESEEESTENENPTLEERRFLHDLRNHVGAAISIVDLLQYDIAQKNGHTITSSSTEIIDVLEKTLNKAIDCIVTRHNKIRS